MHTLSSALGVDLELCKSSSTSETTTADDSSLSPSLKKSNTLANDYITAVKHT